MEEAYSHDWLQHTLDYPKDFHDLPETTTTEEEQAHYWLFEPRGLKQEFARSLASLWFSKEIRPSRKMRIGVIEELVESVLVDLFETRDVVYPSDVVAILDLDYDLVDTIFAKFVRQGKLKE